VGLLDSEQGIADVAGGLEHVGDRTQTHPPGPPVQVPAQAVEQFLGGAEVPGGQHHEKPVAGRLEGMEFAIRTDVIDARRDARVTRKHQSRVELDPEAVRHGNSTDALGPGASNRG
jgi:hypothetical protein